MRPSGREANQAREIRFTRNYTKHAEGSVLVEFGDTKVLCTASIENRVPPWMRDKGQGWVTAEYGMLPRSTGSRMPREAARGKQSGRTQEIQRLIGRSLRASIDLKRLGEHTIHIDCDVLQADGGTRTAAISGSFVALHDAINALLESKAISQSPINQFVASVSVGVFNQTAVLDLDYAEDSNAIADANFVMTGSGSLVEVQATAEERPFSQQDFSALMTLAEAGIRDLVVLQKQSLG